jgi:hypothetical protein
VSSGKDRFLCTSCGKEKHLTRDFYTSFSPLHKATGRLHVCKSCVAESVDINNIKTFMDMLRKLDKPFITHLYESAITRKAFIGEYFQLINSKDFSNLTWDDSDFQGHAKSSDLVKQQSTFLDEEFQNEQKVYSKTWLGHYLPSEIEYLEEYLKGLDRDFRIVTLSHRDYAKKIAKASLHMDKCFQEMQEGVSGADKKYREAKDIFDTLSKSAKFSESQRGITDVGMGSISQIVEMVESETWVYEHKNDLDKDMYDKLIDDFQHIYKSL